jgi:hypothetical protein
MLRETIDMGLFKKSTLSPFQAAVKKGRLVDMQVKPYIEFNRFLQYDAPTGIAPAAFKEFIDIPREKGHPRIHKAARWALLISAVHNCIPHSENPEAVEAVIDVEIVTQSGFNRFKRVMVRVEQAPDNPAVVLMMPDEEYPLPS